MSCATASFYIAAELRMVFVVLNAWKKLKIVFCDMQKLYSSQIPGCIQFYWNIGSFVYGLSVAASMLQW